MDSRSNLANMTREDLYALDDNEIFDLADDNNLDWSSCNCDLCWRDKKHELLKELDTLRLELQQAAAEARCEKDR